MLSFFLFVPSIRRSAEAEKLLLNRRVWNRSRWNFFLRFAKQNYSRFLIFVFFFFFFFCIRQPEGFERSWAESHVIDNVRLYSARQREWRTMCWLFVIIRGYRWIEFNVLLAKAKCPHAVGWTLVSVQWHHLWMRKRCQSPISFYSFDVTSTHFELRCQRRHLHWQIHANLDSANELNLKFYIIVIHFNWRQRCAHRALHILRHYGKHSTHKSYKNSAFYVRCTCVWVAPVLCPFVTHSAFCLCQFLERCLKRSTADRIAFTQKLSPWNAWTHSHTHT